MGIDVFLPAQVRKPSTDFWQLQAEPLAKVDVGIRKFRASFKTSAPETRSTPTPPDWRSACQKMALTAR